jgi:hypothetical protein
MKSPILKIGFGGPPQLSCCTSGAAGEQPGSENSLDEHRGILYPQSVGTKPRKGSKNSTSTQKNQTSLIVFNFFGEPYRVK